ncbi:Hypothetical protein SRAE_X000224300 [Strongyloides ratti]|uniref:Uncharacterized protein n=1 Tax=Strongyloides ratti TaxID=34506 RepID=A0A090KZ39_STRRB|nr:Hypothetical protein SRAE_X000224300 [Strongyloides ratti]CEF60504.1 Hypothetical protein SRAE_X000224300 [Strongyloides ratti]
MHFIKYLAIFAIFAIQFSLQKVSSEESSSQVAVSSQENNLSEEEVVQGKKSLFGNFKDKFNKKTKVFKSKFDQIKNNVKSKLENAKNEVSEKLKQNSKVRKGLEMTDKLKNKASGLGKKLKDRVSKLF